MACWSCQGPKAIKLSKFAEQHAHPTLQYLIQLTTSYGIFYSTSTMPLLAKDHHCYFAALLCNTNSMLPVWVRGKKILVFCNHWALHWSFQWLQVFQAFLFTSASLTILRNYTNEIVMDTWCKYSVVSNMRLLHRQTITATGIWFRLWKHIEKMTRSCPLTEALMWLARIPPQGYLVAMARYVVNHSVLAHATW